MDEHPKGDGSYYGRIAVNFSRDEMFDDVDRPGPLLAWVAFILLCKTHKKSPGVFEFNGKVRAALRIDYNLSDADIDDMLRIGEQHGKLIVEGRSIRFKNWHKYQDSIGGRRKKDPGKRKRAAVPSGVDGVTDE